MQAIIDATTHAWLGIEGEAGTPTLDPAIHERVEVAPSWPEYSRWMAEGAGGAGFYPVASPPKLYTFNGWVDLFPFAEQVAIVTATMTDPVAKLIYDRAMAASGSIDPTDPRTIEGLGYLVSKGYVTQATFESITGV